MPSVLLAESLTAELSAVEPWPEDAKLYEPLEEYQILPDKSNCLSVKAYLSMCSLNFQLESRVNAESMSPSGHVPFIRCGSFVISEVDSIVNFVLTKGISLSNQLTNSERADMKAYISLVNMVLHHAELYASWCDKTALSEVTKPKFNSSLPWPVNHILCWQTKNSIKKKLRAVDWHLKSKDDVYEEVNNCCHALSERLGTSQKFFFGNKPTELDAIVFGHVFAILTTPLPDNRLASTVREYQNLVELSEMINNQYLKNMEEKEMCENLVTTES